MASPSSSAADPAQHKYLQCLTNHSSTPISQAIYFPTDPLYTSTLESNIRNLVYASDSTPRPLFIVAATHVSHIQSTILCCKAHGLQLRIRSGGHDFDGLSYVSPSPFVLLDLFNLRSVTIDVESETAWVNSGATLGELYHEIAGNSKILGFPGGVCPTVGVGGFLSGGGYGNLMRKHGLSVDNVVDAIIVDSDGRVLDREAMGEDLFWAINGGGGASFGVIVSWKIRLVPVPETVTVFRVERTLEQGASDVVHKWQLIADKLHEDLFIRVVLIPVPITSGDEEKFTIKAKFNALFLGKTERLMGLMDHEFPELGLSPADCLEMSWIESVLFWSNYPPGLDDENNTAALLSRELQSIKSGKRKSDYVVTPIPKASLEGIWAKMMESGKTGFVFNPYGGAMDEVPAAETAFPHRAGNLYKIQYSIGWKEPGVEAEEKYLGDIRRMYSYMTPFVSKNPRRAYMNYRDLDIGTVKRGSKNSYAEGKVYGDKYFDGNFERLVKVKTAVDPNYFFWNEQSVPVLPGKVEL
ncbi:unnamed protein product [Linum tenue]|uniref:FAD-binding PCMH-type domain-containing protein n=1 Tax=Linum tenue TaxID=586396 RepID=A0AAV0QJW9_9ROSI|nr:unnamed protein product [Linum tenue]